MNKRKRIRMVICAALAVIFTFCFFCGQYFDRGYQFQNDPWGILKLILIAAAVLLVTGFLYKVLDVLRKKDPQNKTMKINKMIFDQHPGIKTWLILIVVWLPNYILYYPGCLTYDAINQLEQFSTGQWSNHHPILTTLIESVIVIPMKNIGRFEMGVALYLALVLLFSSGMIALGFKWMKRNEVHYSIRWIGLLFFCIYPLWSAYARTLVKDTLFYPIYYLFILYLFDIVVSYEDFFKSKRQISRFSIICLTLCLIRHNGFYIVIATMAGLIWLCRKYRRNCVIIFLMVIAFWAGYNALLPVFGVIPGGKQEMLSIPFQQTARYVKEHHTEVTKEERRAIEKVLNYKVIAQKYNPNISDPVKNTYKKKDEYLKNYFRVWGQQFLKHPGTYIKATLNGTYGYYSYKTKIKYPCGYNVQPEGHRLYSTNYKLKFNSKLKKARLFYERIVKNIYVKGPLKLLTEPMIYNWFFIIMFGYLIQDKLLRKYWVIFIPFWISFFICLASPVNGDLRYMLPLMSTWILYLGFLVNPKSNARNKRIGERN